MSLVTQILSNSLGKVRNRWRYETCIIVCTFCYWSRAPTKYQVSHWFSTNAPLQRKEKSSFDLFQQIKNPTEKEEESAAKRKPSKKVHVTTSAEFTFLSQVQQLADNILSLSLIEAADLCELCQEALQCTSAFYSAPSAF